MKLKAMASAAVVALVVGLPIAASANTVTGVYVAHTDTSVQYFSITQTGSNVEGQLVTVSALGGYTDEIDQGKHENVVGNTDGTRMTLHIGNAKLIQEAAVEEGTLTLYGAYSDADLIAQSYATTSVDDAIAALKQRAAEAYAQKLADDEKQARLDYDQQVRAARQELTNAKHTLVAAQRKLHNDEVLIARLRKSVAPYLTTYEAALADRDQHTSKWWYPIWKFFHPHVDAALNQAVASATALEQRAIKPLDAAFVRQFQDRQRVADAQQAYDDANYDFKRVVAQTP
jgi:hypothetical protein